MPRQCLAGTVSDSGRQNVAVLFCRVAAAKSINVPQPLAGKPDGFQGVTR
jgi:hypothetical protein